MSSCPAPQTRGLFSSTCSAIGRVGAGLGPHGVAGVLQYPDSVYAILEIIYGVVGTDRE
jgi:hypothetical protein